MSDKLYPHKLADVATDLGKSVSMLDKLCREHGLGYCPRGRVLSRRDYAKLKRLVYKRPKPGPKPKGGA